MLEGGLTFIFYQKYFYDKMDLRLFYFHGTDYTLPYPTVLNMRLNYSKDSFLWNTQKHFQDYQVSSPKEQLIFVKPPCICNSSKTKLFQIWQIKGLSKCVPDLSLTRFYSHFFFFFFFHSCQASLWFRNYQMENLNESKILQLE